MTLTQALYDRICKEYHFELLILCNVDLGQDVMTFDYNAINDCIHVITGNQESFCRVTCGDYDDLYDKLSSLIVGQSDNIGVDEVDDLMTLLSAVQVEAQHGGKVVSLKTIMQSELTKNVKVAFDELIKALSENAYSLKLVEPYAENVDAQLMIAGYRPVLTM